MKDNPEVKKSHFGVVSREMSKLWRALSLEEKARYKQPAAAQTTQEGCAKPKRKRAECERSSRLASRRDESIPRPSQNGNQRSQPPAQAQLSTRETPSRCGKRPRAEAQNHAPDPAPSRRGTQFCIKCNGTDSTPDRPWITCGPTRHLCQSAMHLQCFSPPRQRVPRATWWCPTCEATDELYGKYIYTYQFSSSYYEATHGNTELVAKARGRPCEGGTRAGVASGIPLTQAGAAQRSSAQRSDADFPRLNIQE